MGFKGKGGECSAGRNTPSSSLPARLVPAVLEQLRFVSARAQSLSTVGYHYSVAKLEMLQ